MTLIVSKQASLVHIFFQSAMQLVLLVPLLTMRQFAEERRAGTLELLLTSPAAEIEIVVAKFAATMTVILAMLAATLTYAFILAALRKAGLGARLQRLFGTWFCSPARLSRLGLPFLR